ncbi:outer membrane beta-barrel protein [Desulfoluna spongiiphila]|uniref:outer membrane beta-barrel protein n=1 Tax=Desulfoluna spongiiphila TaxID=419481 RepID=UPI0012579A1F|nr:outer membrane beta-barrel protein [Desulfoluna spongiiphila]VVS95388.1 outer membrane protein/outer membrane enzyme pagp beta-barrel [Desulfoluna spongiiphila]
MKQRICVAVFMVCLALIALPQSVFAGDDGFFIGASLAYAEVGADFDFDDNSKGDFEESDLGYKIFGGLKWGLLGIEGGYVNFGNPDGDTDGRNGDVELDGFDLFGVLTFGLGPVDVFGKLGGFVWDADFSGGDLLHGGDDGFDVAGGIGAAINLGSFGIRAEVEYFDVSGRMDGATMVSTGLVYTF